MLLIFVTFDVLKFETLSEDNARQPENIPSMFVTFDVSKFEMLSDSNFEQPLPSEKT